MRVREYHECIASCTPHDEAVRRRQARLECVRRAALLADVKQEYVAVTPKAAPPVGDALVDSKKQRQFFPSDDEEEAKEEGLGEL